MTVEVFAQTIEELLQAMPSELFEDLNGGVVINEESGEALGSYFYDRNLGCWIEMNYPAFETAFADRDESAYVAGMENELRRLLRQHMEYRAGAIWTGSGILRK